MKKAKAYLPNIQKTFDDIVKFHNGMIERKVKFITEDLNQVESELSAAKQRFSVLWEEEKTLVERLGEMGTLDEWDAYSKRLNNCYNEKGVLEEQERAWKETNEKVTQLEQALTKINNDLANRNEKLQDNIKKFNKYFSDISFRLCGEHSMLSADYVDGTYKFAITNVENNPGEGIKKSQMAAFDIAYICFADSIALPCLHFVLQDQMENVHSNQLTALLTKIIEESGCQYVMPILTDKLPDDIDTDAFVVLKLSQNDKLFRL